MDKTRLVVKNLPSDIVNITDFFRTNYGAVIAKSFGRRRAIVKFPNESVATLALHNLHQSEICGRIISVEYVGSRKYEPEEAKDQLEQPTDELRIPEFVKTLYSTSSKFGFEQPPPPYLKYCYPKINRSILDSISIALLSNSKFYTQVLHLMNRMNLEPPFLPRDKLFIPPGEPCDAQTQTDFDHESSNLLASDESELQSDNEERLKNAHISAKRKKLDNTKLKKKARKILSSQIYVKPQVLQRDREEDLNQVFEMNKKSNIGSKISMNVSSVKMPEKELEKVSTMQMEDSCEEIGVPKIKSFEDLKTNQIPESQMKDLPIYKNYQRGEPSNKLYIKNLNKNVTEDDLRSIYEMFMTSRSISIKLMQHGRMKGQSFITFEDIGDKLDMVEQALEKTNGYILKNKPMVVSFGKKTSS